MKFEMPTRTKFLYRIMNFNKIETEEIALFYFRHRDDFYSNEQVAALTGYSSNTVRKARETLIRGGFWFSRIGTTLNRAHRFVGLSKGERVKRGLVITEEDFVKFTNEPESMRIIDSDTERVEIDLHQNKAQILVNSIFK